MAFWLGNNFEKVKRDSRRMTLSNEKPFLTRLGGCQLDVLFSVTSFQFTFSLLKMTFLLCGCPLCPHIFDFLLVYFVWQEKEKWFEKTLARQTSLLKLKRKGNDEERRFFIWCSDSFFSKLDSSKGIFRLTQH